jgi:hypothetical protein
MKPARIPRLLVVVDDEPICRRVVADLALGLSCNSAADGRADQLRQTVKAGLPSAAARAHFQQVARQTLAAIAAVGGSP